MRMRYLSALVMMVAAFGVSPAVAQLATDLDYQLDVRFVPDESRMSGVADITLHPGVPDTLIFYLHGELNVHHVMWNGDSVGFNQPPVFYRSDYSLVATRIAVDIGSLQTGTLHVEYDGYFQPSKARSPSDYMRIDSDGVFLRAYEYSLWFPVFLEERGESPPVTFSRVAIQTPSAFQSVFVGDELSDTVIGGQRETVWRADNIDLYSTQCTAQRWISKTNDNVTVYYSNDPESRLNADTILAFTSRVNDLYRQHYKRDAVPGDIYVMQMPKYGDISSGNVTGLSTESWNEFTSEQWSKRALSHELVHPYVRPSVEMDDSLYALIIEGFPSYFHLPMLGEILGGTFYEDYMKRVEEQYLNIRATGKTRRGWTVPPEKPILQIAPEEIGEYKDMFILSDRALLFLDYLKRTMGDNRFFEFVRELVNTPTVTTKSFRTAVERALPGSSRDVSLWLATTEFPDRFRISRP